MTTTANDISVVLSGGTGNIDPTNSLGGDPSSTPLISGNLNNLFDDVSSDQSTNGFEDFRCIYIFNDGDTTIWNFQIWIAVDDQGGSTMELGIVNRNEAQRITISGGVSGGTVTLQYGGRQFTTSYNSDLSIWASDIEDALMNLTHTPSGSDYFFKKVDVTAQTSGGGTVIFDINWSGKDAERNFEKIGLVTNGNLLEPLNNVNISFATTSEGAPINTIASEIDVSTTPPGGVAFSAAPEGVPIFIPRLDANDGFPLWIMRSTPAGTVAKESDGFTIQFSAQSLES